MISAVIASAICVNLCLVAVCCYSSLKMSLQGSKIRELVFGKDKSRVLLTNQYISLSTHSQIITQESDGTNLEAEKPQRKEDIASKIGKFFAKKSKAPRTCNRAKSTQASNNQTLITAIDFGFLEESERKRSGPSNQTQWYPSAQMSTSPVHQTAVESPSASASQQYSSSSEGSQQQTRLVPCNISQVRSNRSNVGKPATSAVADLKPSVQSSQRKPRGRLAVKFEKKLKTLSQDIEFANYLPKSEVIAFKLENLLRIQSSRALKKGVSLLAFIPEEDEFSL